MASLRTMVGLYKDELREGIAWVAFWKKGRSWNAAAFWLDNDDQVEEEDLPEVLNILAEDPEAIFINGYHNCPFSDGSCDMELSSVPYMEEHIRRRYEDHFDLLNQFVYEEGAENKQEICDHLLPALQATRGFYDLVSLTYHKFKGTGEERVEGRFRSGYVKYARVTMDSGTAMITDIIRQMG